MRILLDECMPKRLKRLFPGHTLQTVQEMGWSGKRNGLLLELMNAGGFAAFITTDRNLPHQQNLTTARFATFVLKARSNRLNDLEPLVARLREVIGRALPGELHVVD